MLYAFDTGELELRRRGGGGFRVEGRFPYNSRTVLSDGGRSGRPRKEVFKSKAFNYRVEKPDEDIHLLVGHDYGRPLARKATGTLKLVDTDEALEFKADIPPELEATSWVQDTRAALAAGMIGGISPGFRIPPERRAPNAVEITEEGEIDPDSDPPKFNAIIRNINEALLYEISLVTVPAYKETEVDARNWEVTEKNLIRPRRRMLL